MKEIVSCLPSMDSAFEPMSKRRRGYSSETHVKRGLRIVHGDKELIEKLGRNDPCPCLSGRRFQIMLSHTATFLLTANTTSGSFSLRQP